MSPRTIADGDEMAHPNEELLRRELDAVATGASLEDIYTDDVVLHYPGTSSIAGTYRGFDGLNRFFELLGEKLSSVERESHDILANDEHGVQMLTVRAERKDGRTHRWNAVWVMHVRDGKIAEAWGTIEDQAALDAFLDA